MEPAKLLLASKSTRELAQEFGVTENRVRDLRAAQGIETPAPAVRVFQPQVLAAPRLIVTSDWHIPYHKPGLVAEVLSAAREYAAEVVCVGDMIDLPTISRFDARDIDSYVGMEISAVGDVLYEFVRHNIKVHWSRGNHELRFFRALKHQVSITDLIRMCVGDTDMVVGYENEDLWTTGKDKWLLTHPSEYSKTPTAVARKLFVRYQCNILTAHNHHYGATIAPDGQHWLVESGGLFDPQKMAYLNRGGANSFPHQANGYWILLEGELIWSRVKS